MAKFHVNPATGGISRCRAESQPCPFGGESGKENHFDSIAEAKAGYEHSMKDSVIQTHSKPNTPSSDATPPAEAADSAELSAAKLMLVKATSKWKSLDKRVKRGESNPNFKFTKTWYQLIQERKDAYYNMRLAYENREKAFPEEVQARRAEDARIEKEKDAARFEAWKARKEQENGPYDFHPPIEGPAEREAQQVLTSYSGMSEDEISEKVAAHEATGLSKTEAYRKVWAEAPLRTDKPLVMLDLEVASPMIRNRVDTGPYSSIIEVGYVKRWPDGRVQEDSYLCGVPKNLHETEGTGAEHIHNISPEMVKGLKPFTEDGEKQKKLMETLRGSVLVAHNASYEVSQFSHNLPGFNSAMDRGQVEVLDTRMVVKNFMPETEKNANQDFVEAGGESYEGAHRALDDAKMTMAALFNHRDAIEKKS